MNGGVEMKLFLNLLLVLLFSGLAFAADQQKQSPQTWPTKVYVEYVNTQAVKDLCLIPGFEDSIKNKKGKSCPEIMRPIFKECTSDLEKTYGPKMTRKNIDEIAPILFFCSFQPLAGIDDQSGPRISADSMKKLQLHLVDFMHNVLGR